MYFQFPPTPHLLSSLLIILPSLLFPSFLSRFFPPLSLFNFNFLSRFFPLFCLQFQRSPLSLPAAAPTPQLLTELLFASLTQILPAQWSVFVLAQPSVSLPFWVCVSKKPFPSPKKRPASAAQSSDCPDKTKTAKLDDASTLLEPFPNGGFDFINDGFDQFANGGFPREELSPTFCNWEFGELAPTKCVFCIAKEEEEGNGEVQEEEEEEEEEEKN
ncbi:hypothetical protein GPALN_008024 [Globodera pallida]|nr:hypothetical protein GPALN_008024 [Globodera pallida]